MTVGELRKALEGVADDVKVVSQDFQYGYAEIVDAHRIRLANDNGHDASNELCERPLFYIGMKYEP